MDKKNIWSMVLVAGESQRFEGVKALAPWKDGTLLSNALDIAQKSTPKKVLTVLGGHSETIQETLPEGSRYVKNHLWQKGMGQSISCGIKKIREMDLKTDGVLILPVDQPLISLSHIEKLVSEFERTNLCVLTASQDGVVGPPAIVARSFLEKASKLDGVIGLKSFLNHTDFVTVTSGDALRDVDTNEDLAEIANEQGLSLSIARYATQLSLVEIVLGSFAHGFKVPFGGNLLSLNQGAFLSRASLKYKYDRKLAAFVPMQVSSVSAILKSLSPAGQKLGPMLAIGMQGFLYSFVLLIFGPSRVAQSLGLILLSVWAFLQPILMLWLFYGKSLADAGLFYYTKLNQTMPLVADLFAVLFIGFLFLKLSLAAAIPWLLSYFGEEEFDQWTSKASSHAVKIFKPKSRPQAQSQWQVIKNTLSDLTRPAFLFPCLLIAFFVVFFDRDSSQWIWKMMRPFAVATVFFYVSNTPWIYRFFSYLRNKNKFPLFFRVLDQTQVNLTNWAKKSMEQKSAD